MEPHLLLDTNIFIYIRQKRPNEVLERFRKLRPGDAALSVVTYGELLYGVFKSKDRAAALQGLRELVRLVPVLPLPETAGEVYGAQRADLELRGELIGNNDLWIAAHALAAGLTLVTNNEKEFRRLRGLKLQSWGSGA